MKTYLTAPALMACLFLNVVAFSQPKEFKFGKIEPTDLSATVCPIDSGADAYIIGDFGNAYFEYQQEQGFISIFERHFRIKILKKSALDWATNVVALYQNGSTEEKLYNLKATTYNLENGSVVASKMDKSAVFKEVVSEKHLNMRFALPNVKEGSVIEVSYSISSPFHYVRDWDFQSSIPTLATVYIIKIPEYYNYKEFQNGYEALHSDVKTENSSLEYTWKEERKSGSGGVNTAVGYNTNSETIHFQSKTSSYWGINMKAFRDEPYMKSNKNYLSSIELELQTVQFPYSIMKDYTSSWTKISKSLLDYDDFGQILKKTGATDDITDPITKVLTNPLDQARAIYSTIRDNYKWNGLKRLYASQTIRKTIDLKSGNSSDINLLLTTALRNAHLKANPVVLSTRDNGMILMEFPILQKLNYVIAAVEIDGKQYLLDATDKSAPFGFLPERCLNDKGQMITDDYPKEVDLTSGQSYSRNRNLIFKINEAGELSGSLLETRKGYAAHEIREDIRNAKSMDDYVQQTQKKTTGITFDQYKFENLDSLNKDVRQTSNVTITGQVETAGNLLMIHPLTTEQMRENIFRLDDRKFPVDYSYPISLSSVVQFEIPQGYQVETLPQSTTYALPGRDVVYSYMTATTGNNIQVLRKMQVNKVIFLPAEYAGLKEFYNRMVAKEAEMIVLKKL